MLGGVLGKGAGAGTLNCHTLHLELSTVQGPVTNTSKLSWLQSMTNNCTTFSLSGQHSSSFPKCLCSLANCQSLAGSRYPYQVTSMAQGQPGVCMWHRSHWFGLCAQRVNASRTLLVACHSQ